MIYSKNDNVLLYGKPLSVSRFPCCRLGKPSQLHWEGAMVYVCLHELLIESMEQLGVTKAVLVGVPRMGPGMQDDEAGTSMGNEHPGMPS